MYHGVEVNMLDVHQATIKILGEIEVSLVSGEVAGTVVGVKMKVVPIGEEGESNIQGDVMHQLNLVDGQE